MRDPARIPIVLAKLAELWKKHPDWRLGQLIVNLAGRDPFFMEDDELSRLIDKVLVDGWQLK